MAVLILDSNHAFRARNERLKEDEGKAELRRAEEEERDRLRREDRKKREQELIEDERRRKELEAWKIREEEKRLAEEVC